MGFPKKIKKDIKLYPERTLYPRRLELFEKINENGTFLPKSIMHADLDKGFLDFVIDELELSLDGKKVPVIEQLITTQNWYQFTQTWNFQDLDKNTSLPFIAIVRSPDVKYGSTPQLQYTIPNRRQFYYASVPSFDGSRLNVDVYKIPQPVPVDIKFSIKIVCNRMRELNNFNKVVLQKFSSRQAYTQIKGHYIPIIMDNIQDESVMDLEKRRFYMQSYEFTLMGFIMDEDEFEIKPAVERVFQLFEVQGSTKKKEKLKREPNPSSYPIDIVFEVGTDEKTKIFYDVVDLSFLESSNSSSYDVYINDQFYGTSLSKIQINNNDSVRFVSTKIDNSKESKISFVAKLV